MKKNALLIFLNLAIAITAYCQQEKNGRNTVEKTYLQFDKPYYAIGDTIYFKAYVTLGAENKLSALSWILYAELFSPENKVAKALKLQITAGTASGDFIFAVCFFCGFFWVCVFSSWLR